MATAEIVVAMETAEMVGAQHAKTLEGKTTATKENPNVNTHPFGIAARRHVGSANLGAQATLAAQQVTLAAPTAGIHIKKGPATAKSGNLPAEMTITPTFGTIARKLVVFAAHRARTRTAKDLATAGSGKNRALMTDILAFKRIVAKLVDDVVNYS